MRFYIPSYKRVGECRTLEYLERCGVSAQDIHANALRLCSIQKVYKGRCEVIFREGRNVAMNRNTCILHARETGCKSFVMLDDDTDCIMSFIPKRDTRIEGDKFKDFLDGISRLMERNIALIGLYPISNNMFAMSQKPITKNLLVGRFLAFGTTDYLFNEEYRIKEDYELCLRLMSKGEIVLRLNRFYSRVKLNGDGGCKEDFQKGYSKVFSDKLLLMYPDLVKRGCRAGEIALR